MSVGDAAYQSEKLCLWAMSATLRAPDRVSGPLSRVPEPFRYALRGRDDLRHELFAQLPHRDVGGPGRDRDRGDDATVAPAHWRGGGADAKLDLLVADGVAVRRDVPQDLDEGVDRLDRV